MKNFSIAFDQYMRVVADAFTEKLKIKGDTSIVIEKDHHEIGKMGFEGTLFRIDLNPILRIKKGQWNWSYDLSTLKSSYENEYPIEYVVSEMISSIEKAWLKQLFK